MLEVFRCARPEDKRALFADFDGEGAAWIVPDLQSKWHLQKELLKRRGVLEQSCVLRATELWRRFAFQLRPDIRWLSSELAQTLFWNWIEPMNLAWARSPRAVPVVLNQMQMWMSVLSDPRHEEVMAQWFRANPEAYVRWGHWFELCAELWRRCRQDRLIMMAWLPAVLLNEDLASLDWDKSLTFDLGPRISMVEGQLIKELARHHDVRVIFPEAPWAELMKSSLRPYDDLLDRPYRGDPDWRPARNARLTFGRYSTQLAEVKDTVARVRAWLDEGIEPQKIAVVAPDIEEYWPALQLYLAEEGIPACKPLTARIGGFAEMARWISALRTSLARVNAADLEVFLFAQPGEKPPLSFDDFRILFTFVYDAGDLNRAEALFRSGAPPPESQALGVVEFLGWALRHWAAGADSQRLKTLLQVVGQEVPQALELSPAQWLGYIEGILARRELNLRPADEGGIWCVSLSSADWLPATHGVFLNLCEGALRSLEDSPVGDGEARQVLADTGYAVGTCDHQENEFALLWFLNRDWTDLRLCFAGTDFAGKVLTPSKLWMWAAFSNEKLKHQAEAPLPTRWDEIQRLPLSGLARVREWGDGRAPALERALWRDRSPEAPLSWRPSREERLSASSLENYWRCPFVFAATRRFKLSDEPALDLDMDRMTRGRLLHALVEALSAKNPEEPWNFTPEDEELLALIEAVRAREDLRLGDERLWPAARARHLRLARYFLAFERDWRERFPATRTVARELAFECGWDIERGEPTREPTGIVLAGRMDRVDQDSHGRYALIDYKSSANGLRNWSNWLKNHEIQLALYALLLESGLGGVVAGPVMAANYYVIKDSDRRKGFHLRDESSELYSCADKHRNFVSDEDKAELFLALREKINSAVNAIMKGEFPPRPEDEKNCAACSWRKLCRAPHLD